LHASAIEVARPSSKTICLEDGEPGYPRPTAFLPGRWDIGQMFDWAGVIWHAMPPIPRFSSFDIDEATNRLEFGAADSSGRPRETERFSWSLDRKG
jgi:hypothetical protein